MTWLILSRLQPVTHLENIVRTMAGAREEGQGGEGGRVLKLTSLWKHRPTRARKIAPNTDRTVQHPAIFRSSIDVGERRENESMMMKRWGASGERQSVLSTRVDDEGVKTYLMEFLRLV